MSTDLKRIVEAVLFAAETPLSLAQICQVLETKDKAPVQTAIEELCREYDYLERAFDLVEVAGGWRLRTRPDMAFWLRKLKRQSATRLSRASLETLAIIAYKQPVLKAEIERIRGVEVSGVLRMLMEKDLVRVVGRKDLPGRPLIYGTTKRFLEVFDLKDLTDLPTLEEMQDLLGDADLASEGQEEEAPLFTRGLAGQDEEVALDEEPEGGEAQDDSEPGPDEEAPSAAGTGSLQEALRQAEAGRPEDDASGQPEPAGELADDRAGAYDEHAQCEVELGPDMQEKAPANEPTPDLPGGETEPEARPAEQSQAAPNQAQVQTGESSGQAAQHAEPDGGPEEPSGQTGPDGYNQPRGT